MHTKKKIGKKWIPVAAILIMVCLLFFVLWQTDGELSVQTILRYTPDNHILAAFVLLLFFALKSLTIVFPITALFMVNGLLFSSPVALFVSTMGVCVTVTVPYLLGRVSGGDMVRSICHKYPKAEWIYQYQQKNTLFACFFTRIIGCLPGDVVSLYFGACETSYPIYLIGSLLGASLMIVTDTFLGEQLEDPFSKTFILLLLFRVLISVAAILGNMWWNRRRNEKDTSGKA